MAEKMERVLIKDITLADVFSLALDESTDISNNAQLKPHGWVKSLPEFLSDF